MNGGKRPEMWRCWTGVARRHRRGRGDEFVGGKEHGLLWHAKRLKRVVLVHECVIEHALVELRRLRTG